MAKAASIAAQIVDCARALVEGRESAHPELLARFEGMYFPELTDADVAALRAIAAETIDALIVLLGDSSDTTRHFSAYLLGFADDARVVDPLVELLAAQRDHFDHDYCYTSLGRLGARAHEALYEIATAKTSGSSRRVQAIQALGQSREDPLPWLAKLAALDPLPDGYFSALENTHDPRALPVLEFGLWHEDAQQRGDALFTAYCLLESAREGDHPIVSELDVACWGTRMLELLRDEELDEPEVALPALGFLDYGPGLATIREALASEESRENAVTALRWLSSPEALQCLCALLDHEDSEFRCHAAVALRARSDVDTATRERASRIAFDALFAVEHNSPWCAAADALPEEIALREELLEIASSDEDARAASAADVLSYWARWEDDVLEELCARAPRAAARLRKSFDGDDD